MSEKNSIRIIVGIIAVVALVFGIISLSSEIYQYNGKILLNEAEYEQFKVFLSDKDIDIDEINILSSSPKLIDYSITVHGTSNMPFDYNNKINMALGGGIALLTLCFLVSMLLVYLLKDKSEW